MQLAGLMRSLPLRKPWSSPSALPGTPSNEPTARGTDVRFGVNFEECLAGLIRRLKGLL